MLISPIEKMRREVGEQVTHMVAQVGEGPVTVILNGVVREGFRQKVTFEQRPEGGGGICHGFMREGYLQGRKGKCKDPKVGGCLMWRKTRSPG